MARRVIDYRENIDSDTVVSVTIWKVPESENFPEGIKYKLQAFDADTGKTLLRYDNHNDAHEARHHKHVGESNTKQIENPFKHVNTKNSQNLSEAVMKLIRRFEDEVESR